MAEIFHDFLANPYAGMIAWLCGVVPVVFALFKKKSRNDDDLKTLDRNIVKPKLEQNLSILTYEVIECKERPNDIIMGTPFYMGVWMILLFCYLSISNYMGNYFEFIEMIALMLLLILHIKYIFPIQWKILNSIYVVFDVKNTKVYWFYRGLFFVQKNL